MNSSVRRELYNANRRERQSKARQALLVNDYVYTKYFPIYREAAQYYNQLNALYPTKRDLRRCNEFKKWKRDTCGQTVQAESPDRPVQNTRRNTSYHIVFHPNISLDQHLELTVPESPDLDLSEQQLERIVPESPDLDLSGQQQLERTVPESPDLDLSEQQQLERTVPESPDRSESSANPKGKKIMELKIPLMKPSVVTETLQIITQETIQEEGNPLQVAAEETIQDSATIYPTLEEELPHDIIDRIINELRQDPGLNTIMAGIEQDLEFERLGMELDIPEDRLENELENFML